MKPDVAVDELIEHFTLLPPEITFLGRNDPHNQLGKALLLKFFQAAGRFPENENEFTPAMALAAPLAHHRICGAATAATAGGHSGVQLGWTYQLRSAQWCDFISVFLPRRPDEDSLVLVAQGRNQP